MLHILPGDSLVPQFPEALAGELLICRECLIVGPLQGNSLIEFWHTRAQFIAKEYGAHYYAAQVCSEFEKLHTIPPDAEIALWFEHELFCQLNLWFVIQLLHSLGKHNLYRVFPCDLDEPELWQGFGGLPTTELEHCFSQRVKLSATDVQHGVKLWEAYRNEDFASLQQLSRYRSPAFPLLQSVCAAEIARKQEQALERLLQNIIAEGAKDFATVFAMFQQQAGIYGLGDLQVQRLYQQIMQPS